MSIEETKKGNEHGSAVISALHSLDFLQYSFEVVMEGLKNKRYLE